MIQAESAPAKAYVRFPKFKVSVTESTVSHGDGKHRATDEDDTGSLFGTQKSLKSLKSRCWFGSCYHVNESKGSQGVTWGVNSYKRGEGEESVMEQGIKLLY